MTTDKATDIIQRIIAYDTTHCESVYHIARLLTTLRDLKLHEALGYVSFNEMVRAELPFSITKANAYLRMQNQLTRLRYTKKQALQLISDHSPSEIAAALAHSDTKLTSDAVRAANQSEASTVPFTVQLHERDYQRLERHLERYGLGRAKVNRTNVASSLLALLDAYERLIKQVEDKEVA